MIPLKIKFQNILKIDKKISEDFFNKFSINDVFKKERIQENETYLDNTYKFIGETNVLTS